MDSRGEGDIRGLCSVYIMTIHGLDFNLISVRVVVLPISFAPAKMATVKPCPPYPPNTNKLENISQLKLISSFLAA